MGALTDEMRQRIRSCDRLSGEDLEQIIEYMAADPSGAAEAELIELAGRDRWAKVIGPQLARYTGLGVDPDYTLPTMAEIEEKAAEFLVPGFIPRGTITTLVGDGGVGKTAVWCAIAAAISRGDQPFFVQDEILPGEWTIGAAGNVLVFSGEDSAEHVLKKRLKDNCADMSKVSTMLQSDPRFARLEFGGDLIGALIRRYRPALCIFDPIQSFLTDRVDMGSRNAMRRALQPLAGLGEECGTAFLLVCHTNKRDAASGRNRMADSADLWDLSRSVLMMGRSNDRVIMYLSHEKSNYGPLQQTALFKLRGSRPEFVTYTDKKDEDFVAEKRRPRAAPAQDEAADFWNRTLAGGEKTKKEIDEEARAQGISAASLERARKDLINKGAISFGKRGKQGETVYKSTGQK